MLCFYSKELCHNRTLSIVKVECTRIVCKKVDKAINDDVVQPHEGVMQITFLDNVFTGLNLSFATWATSGKVGKKSLPMSVAKLQWPE